MADDGSVPVQQGWRTTVGVTLSPLYDQALNFARVLELGLVERDGLRFRVPSPKIMRVGAEIVKMGIPLRELLDIIAGLRRNVERVADELLQIAVKSIDRYGDGLPPAEDVPRLAEMIGRLRPLADRAIESEVSRAMERALGRFLGDRLAQVLDHLPQYRDPR